MKQRKRLSIVALGMLSLLTLFSPRAVAQVCDAVCREVLGRGFLAEPRFTIDLSQPRGRSIDGVPGLDVVQVKVRLAPGARGPWHYHPGPALIVVKRGTFKLTQDNKDCSSVEYPAGSVLAEEAFHIHQPSNPGSEETEVYILFVVPPEPTPDQIVIEPKACKM
jgi:quercetin dioxygenase-like cupin family protein